MEVEPAVHVDATIDLKTIPASSLNVSSRMKLSLMLNPEQALRSSGGYARDYRGLAEQMDFTYYDIRNFQRTNDPILKILEAWEGKQNSTVGLLIEYIEKMERYDVIEDTRAQFENDALSYLRRSRRVSQIPIQVPEITSGRQNSCQTENSNAITIGDILTGGCTYYDAYVCYAEEDVGFVDGLTRYLESDKVGLKLCLKGRDLLLGTSELDSHTKLIQDRCERMLIILSTNLINSTECEFEMCFAAGLAMEQKKRKLIPILIESCEIPLYLQFISKLDFTKPELQQEWVWLKLIQSIRGSTSTIFVSPPGHVPIQHHQGSAHPESSLGYSSNPIITYPPTVNHTQNSNAYLSILTPMSSPVPSTSSAASPSTSLRLSVVSATVPKTTPPTKNKWYHNIKGRLSSGKSSSAQASSSSSSATSGFHSLSSFVSEKSDENDDKSDENDDNENDTI